MHGRRSLLPNLKPIDLELEKTLRTHKHVKNKMDLQPQERIFKDYFSPSANLCTHSFLTAAPSLMSLCAHMVEVHCTSLDKGGLMGSFSFRLQGAGCLKEQLLLSAFHSDGHQCELKPQGKDCASFC